MIGLPVLDECEYEVVDAWVTRAVFSAPNCSWKRWLIGGRRVTYAFHRDGAVRLLRGETLMVLACLRDLT